MKNGHKEALIKAYHENKLIPFIGTGLSVPFSIPKWGELIEIISLKHVDTEIQPIIKLYLDRKDYWKAIDTVIDVGHVNEFKIQEEICRIVSEKMQQEIEDELHNYKDLVGMNFKNYLTTNYDFLISKYINNPLSVPQVFYKVDINSHSFFEDRDYPKVWHMHGHISDTGSIVITKNKYDSLYNDEKYKDFFKLFQGYGTLLFIGFSFDDEYIQELLTKNNFSYNSEHYILLDNPSEATKSRFAKEYGINVIGYDSNKGGHTQGIRRILSIIKGEDRESISNEDDSDSSGGNAFRENQQEEGFLSIPTSDDRQALESCLFCKKIRMEDIHEITLDFSKDCFFCLL